MGTKSREEGKVGGGEGENKLNSPPPKAGPSWITEFEDLKEVVHSTP